MKEKVIFYVTKSYFTIRIIQFLLTCLFCGTIFVYLPKEIHFIAISTLIIIIVLIINLLITPHKITLKGDDIEFKSVINTQKFAISKIKSIKIPVASTVLSFHIKKWCVIYIPNHISDFYLLMSHLKAINPEIKNYGC